jgi:hypothetical protein
MQTYGEMQFKTLFKKILGKFAKSMRGMKGCIDTRFLKWKKVMPSFEYEPLVMSLEPEISDEEENKVDINGVGH